MDQPVHGNIDANKNYEDVAKTWEGDFLFLIEPDGSVSEPSTFYVDLWHGKCRGVALLKSSEEKNAAFVYSGPYGNWKRLIDKEIDPIQGLLTGKFKSKGDMVKVLRAVRAAKELVETAGNVPDLNRQLKEYYSLRGWDPKTGHPTMETLRELALEPLSRYLPTKNRS